MFGKLSEWGPLPLRLILGFGFVYHGFPKVSSVEGHQTFAAMLSGMSVPAPGVMAWVVGLVEVAGGVALIVGAFVVVASVLLTCDMLVALFKAHLAAGFSFINIKGMGPDGPIFGLPGYEVNLLYIGALLTLILAGAGALSIDQWRRHRSRRYHQYLRK
jgi:putative oxidoreductase